MLTAKDKIKDGKYSPVAVEQKITDVESAIKTGKDVL